jgi:hypothetical protein
LFHFHNPSIIVASAILVFFDIAILSYEEEEEYYVHTPSNFWHTILIDFSPKF